MTDINPILETAVEFHKQGICVIPSRMDGTKAPIGTWKEWQSQRPSLEQLIRWFADGKQTGLGVVCGAISGNLLMLELEGRAIEYLDEIEATIEAAGLTALFEKICSGYMERSPSGGIHWLFKVDGAIEGNQKLAQLPDGDSHLCLAETRGEGGFVIVAPSHGTVHPSGGEWRMLDGSPATIPTLTVAESKALLDAFRTIDKVPAMEERIERIKSPSNGTRPGDVYHDQTSWEDILIPLGWKLVYTKASGQKVWRRPGKTIGISATSGQTEADNLWVFSTSTIFPANQPLSKFAAYAYIHHNGDFSAASRDLAKQGFGTFEITPLSPLDTAKKAQEADTSEESDVEEREFQHQLKKAQIAKKVKETMAEAEAFRTYDRLEYVASLEEELELPIEEVEWVIPDLFPTGTNVTITAQYKAGKTTLVNSLARALADGEPFLNYFKQANHKGQIVIFNYEVTKNQYRRWLKDVGIINRKKVTMVHLRGKSTPLTSEFVRKDIIEQLKRLECQTWIVDPFARAFTGSGDENSNSDVGKFLDLLDVIKEKAGVANLILPVHTGRAQEFGIDRARGATRIDDWADVRWILKKTDDGRFFSADGRDVLLEEQQLRFDEKSRGLTLGGSDSRTAKKLNAEDSWVEIVCANPGLTTGELCQLLGKSTDDKTLANARKAAIAKRRVKTRKNGRAENWFPFDYIPPFQVEAI